MQAEAASSAGDSSFRAFMAAIKSATTNMAMLQRVTTLPPFLFAIFLLHLVNDTLLLFAVFHEISFTGAFSTRRRARGLLRCNRIRHGCCWEGGLHRPAGLTADTPCRGEFSLCISLQHFQLLDEVLAETHWCNHQVERLLVAEQKTTDYTQLDESISPELTTACSRWRSLPITVAELNHNLCEGLIQSYGS